MSGAPKAVFISYAREDSAAALRLCEALRGAGIEVWFDQSELGGGDAWDAKIRRQIKECALFLPVISANTQARTEGYFRLEWRLADQRTHLMAKGRAFLVPVAIDDTSDANAHVPDSFTEVQWTRLPAGETSGEFLSRIIRLLSSESGSVGQTPAPFPRDTTSAVDRPARSRLPVTVALVATGIAVAGWFYWRRPPTTSPARPSAAAASPEVQRRLVQARELYHRQDDATRDDWVLAAQFAAEATKLDPTNGEAWAVYAQVTLGAYIFGYLNTPEQLAAGLKHAEQAVALAPDSIEARIALANCLRFQVAMTGEAERTLREIIAQHPENKHALRTLASTLHGQRKEEEALKLLDRACALPGGDANALAIKQGIHLGMGRLDLAEGAIDELLVVRPGPFAYLKKALYCLYLRADFNQAAAMLEKVPEVFLTREEGALLASQLHLWQRRPERTLQVLRAVKVDYLSANRIFNSNLFLTTAPTAFLTSQVHALAGRRGLAEADLQKALQVIQGKLSGEPKHPEYLWWRARLLACLGRKVEAAQALRLFRETSPGAGAATGMSLALIFMPLDRREEVLQLAVAISRERITPREAMIFLGFMRHDPTFEPVRNLPAFVAAIAHLEKATQPASNPSTPRK